MPLPVPDATVSPQFDLPDRAVVNVHSSGFAPGERVLVSQCPADAPTTSSCTDSFSPLNLLTADENGEIEMSLRVHREVTTNDNGGVIILGTTSCADAVGDVRDPGAARSTTRSSSPTSRSGSIPPRWRHRPCSP